MAHIYINGFKILQNTGLKRNNTVNYLDGVLTSGKTYHKGLGHKSTEISFESVLTLDQLDNKDHTYLKDSDTKPTEEIRKNQLLAIHQYYLNLVEITKKNAVPINIFYDLPDPTPKKPDQMKKVISRIQYPNDKSSDSFKGRVVSLEWEMPVEYQYKYSWVIREDADFKAVPKTFNTFNYKAPTVTAKKTVTNAPSYIKALYKCSMKHDCTKKKVSCVIHLQKLLQSDGFYRKYKVDGWWCTYTTQEFKKWQKKKAKVKITGKFDKATKAYLKKRFGLGYILGKDLKFTSAAKNPLK